MRGYPSPGILLCVPLGMVTLLPGWSVYFPQYLTLEDGIVVDVGLGSVLEVG